MKVKILKGTNQIGGCITEIASDAGTKILIDYGCDLNKDQEVMPKIEWESIKAVFITHNHDDHIGHINEIPKEVAVYTEDVSFGVYQILNEFLLEKKELREVNRFSIGDTITIGDITVTSFVVDHSAFNSVMYLVECDGKRLLHLGDFRNNGRKGNMLEDTLQQIQKVDVLIMEGTTVTRKDNKTNKTEEKLEEMIEEAVKNYDQVLILQASTNIDRIYTMYEAMTNTDKIFLEDVCTANICSYLKEKGYVDVPNIQFHNVYSFLPFKRREDYHNPSEFYKTYLAPFNKKDGHKKLKDSSYALMIKQSMLADIKKRKKEGCLENACLIYSMWHNYLEDEKMKQFVDELEKMGIKKYEFHTSGHADENTRQLVLNTVQYTYLLPIHTEGKEEFGQYPKAVLLKDGEEFEVK